MNIKDIIDKEKWTKATIDNSRLTPFDWRYLHNLSLDRVNEQVSAHIAELEAQLPKVVKPVFNLGYYDCPECEHRILPGPSRYCSNCGSKLNWEEV